MKSIYFLLLAVSVLYLNTSITVNNALLTEDIRQTMYVDGRYIYSAASEKVILRGVNEMFAYYRGDLKDGWVLKEIAKTGANSVRIVTTINTNSSDLDLIIGYSIENGMIPMPECHSATGRWHDLQNCVDYWLRPDIVEVINRHEKWVLLNIANEAGDSNVTKEEFLEGYISAIDQIREAGIRVPLVIDGVGWGQEYVILLDSWETLNNHDPENAIIVSAHTYWAGNEEDRKNDYRYIIEKVLSEDIPFIFGEGPTPSAWDCTESPYEWALDKLEEAEIGWLAWSWGLVRNSDCNDPERYDMTEGGNFGEWKTEFGRLTAVDHPGSIRNTSRRPCSIPNAGKNCIEARVK